MHSNYISEKREKYNNNEIFKLSVVKSLPFHSTVEKICLLRVHRKHEVCISENCNFSYRHKYEYYYVITSQTITFTFLVGCKL